MEQITPVIDFQQELGEMFDLQGKVAFLPGGYGGIGEAIGCEERSTPADEVA